MKRFIPNSEKSEHRAFLSGSATAGSGSGTTRQRIDGRGAHVSTGGVGVAPSKSVPPSRSSSTSSPATKATAATTGPTSERDAQQRYPSPLTPAIMAGFDYDVDVVQWQSSQTTNPALITLLKEASSEESMLRPSSRISPSWQHPPTKSSMSFTTPTAASSSSASKYSNLGSVSFSDMVVDSHSTSGRMRIRPSASKSATAPLTPHLHDQQYPRQTNVNSIENGDNPPGSGSLFSSGDPNKILEMMRGVSAKIDENMTVNTPVAKYKGKEKATSVTSTRTRQMGRSLSSMDIDVSVDGFGDGGAYNNMRKGTAHEGDNERGGSMMAIDETDDTSADADVSMSYAGAAVDPADIFRSSIEVSRRKEMLPPTLPASKIKSMPPRAGTSSSSTSAQQVHVADRARSAVVSAPTSTLPVDATVDVRDDSKPKDPHIQLHPLLREKKPRKETKRSQAFLPLSVDAVLDSGIGRQSPTFPNLSTKTPLTRSMSASIAPTASQSVRPAQSFFLSPDASQSSRQNPPRLGGSSSATIGNAIVVAKQGNSGKLLAKPFKPPSRKTGPDHGSQQNSGHTAQHGYSQRNAASAGHNFPMSSSSSSSRAAYPSPSPNSDDDGKKGKESQVSLVAEEERGSTRLSMRGRPRSPPALPPTPESVLNGGSGSEGQEDVRRGKRETEGHRGQDDLDEDVEEMEGADPDSSYGHMTLGIDIDALEETMRMFD
ncbi:hypothetical protein APHAL10511_005158 [Amanita phalloides]|nr:hypothetical protein APHAL10511_005158 [Amanita phalloides]